MEVGADGSATEDALTIVALRIHLSVLLQWSYSWLITISPVLLSRFNNNRSRDTICFWLVTTLYNAQQMTRWSLESLSLRMKIPFSHKHRFLVLVVVTPRTLLLTMFARRIASGMFLFYNENTKYKRDSGPYLPGKKITPRIWTYMLSHYCTPWKDALWDGYRKWMIKEKKLTEYRCIVSCSSMGNDISHSPHNKTISSTSYDDWSQPLHYWKRGTLRNI